VVIGDWRTAIGDFDLAVGNPRFDQFHAGILAMRRDPLVPLAEGTPYPGPRARSLLALQSIASLQRGKAGRAIARSLPPAIQFDVPGGVRFRSGINPDNGKPWTTDERSYCAFLWNEAMLSRSAGWPRALLPELPSSARSWTRRPGTEWQTGGEP
jgi:hypothetical protein